MMKGRPIRLSFDRAGDGAGPLNRQSFRKTRIFVSLMQASARYLVEKV